MGYGGPGIKMNREEIKQEILKDLKNKKVKSISSLQIKYNIGFLLAKEILDERKKEDHNDLRNE